MTGINRHIVPIKRVNGKQTKITVAIVGSNANHRMKSYGTKQLLKVHDVPLIQHQINVIKQCFNDVEFYIITGYQTDKIVKMRPNNVHIIENTRFDETNEIEDVRLLLNTKHIENLLIVNNSLYFDAWTFEKANTAESFIIHSPTHMHDQEVGVTVQNEQVTNFAFGMPSKWCNIAYLTQEHLYYFANYCFNRENNNKFIFEGIKDVLTHTLTINGYYPTNMFMKKIDVYKDLRYINEGAH